MNNNPEENKRRLDELRSGKSRSMEQADYRARMREDFDNLIEDLIQDGKEKGIFDNLPGKGRPLNLKRNLFEAEKELAHTLLKENDLPPAWIGERNEILQKTAAMRQEIIRKWAWHEATFEAETENRGRLTISWDDCCQKWLGDIAELNKKITTYNLKRPSERLELYKLNLEDELKRANAPRWLR